MKKFLLALSIVSLTGFSYEQMPEYLKDSVITVRLKDGKEYKFDGNHWKVVRRTDKKQDDSVAVSEFKPYDIEPDRKKVLDKANNEPNKNTVILSFGFGYNGVSVMNNGSQYKIKEDRVPVVGLTYCRQIYNEDLLAPCAIATSNETFMLGVKYGF